MLTLTGAQGTAADDRRARIVESNLKDLSTANDAAIARHRLTADRELDGLGNPRVALQPESISPTDTRVRQDVQSSLHRLRRETVSQQTEDGRTARVQENLDRTARSER
jgi:hypothetical protein